MKGAEAGSAGLATKKFVEPHIGRRPTLLRHGNTMYCVTLNVDTPRAALVTSCMDRAVLKPLSRQSAERHSHIVSIISHDGIYTVLARGMTDAEDLVWCDR